MIYMLAGGAGTYNVKILFFSILFGSKTFNLPVAMASKTKSPHIEKLC